MARETDIRRRFADEREALSRRHTAEMRELNKRETVAIDRAVAAARAAPPPLQWNRSRDGATETKCGTFEIYPEYQGTTRPQAWQLWQNKDGKRTRVASADNQRGAKDEAQRLADADAKRETN